MSKQDYIGALIASCISVFAYQTGFFFFLFLVPLQLLLFRSGIKITRIAVLGVGVALVYLGIRHTAGAEPDVRSSLLLVEIMIPALLLGGFLLVNGFFGKLGGVLLNALLATFCTAVISIVLVTVLDNEAFNSYYKALFSQMFSILKSSISASGDVELVPLMNMDVDTMLDHVSTVFFKGFLFAYFCIVFVSYLFALSVDNLTKRRAGIITVMIPDCFIWILICALSLILVDARFQLNQFLAYAGWNVFLIVMLLYGIRGIGIIRQMLEARGLHPVVRMFLTLAVVVLLMHPLFGRVLLIGIPCVGISEIWFKYKRT